MFSYRFYMQDIDWNGHHVTVTAASPWAALRELRKTYPDEWFIVFSITKMPKTRYVMEHLDAEHPECAAVRNYANDKNAMRYFALLLRKPRFIAGQYRITTTGRPFCEIGRLYKQAER